MQNATEILTLKCSTQKNKAETTLQNHEKTPNFEEAALENDAVGDDLEVHHHAKEAKPSTLTYTSMRIYLKDQITMDTLLFMNNKIDFNK